MVSNSKSTLDEVALIYPLTLKVISVCNSFFNYLILPERIFILGRST